MTWNQMQNIDPGKQESSQKNDWYQFGSEVGFSKYLNYIEQGNQFFLSHDYDCDREKVEKSMRSNQMNYVNSQTKRQRSTNQYFCNSQPYRSNQFSLTFLILIVIFSLLPTLSNSYTLSINSSETYTGVSTNYFFNISSHNNPTYLAFTFPQWSPTIAEPFTTSYRFTDSVTGNGLTCSKRFTGFIECNLTASIFSAGVYPSTITLKMTNAFNPSSTKPYPISLLINNGTFSNNQTYSLTLNTPRPQQIYIDNYNSTIGQTSSALLYLDFKNYLTSTTILALNYNSSIVTMSMLTDSSYTISTDVVGTKILTGWSPATQMLKTLKINITNPSVAASFYIYGVLTFTQNSTTYQIQSYSILIIPTTLAYSSIGTLSSGNQLYLGAINNNISFSAQCPLATTNGPAKNSYFEMTYDNTLITVQNTSNCLASTINGTISTCTITIPNTTAFANNTFQWTNIYSIISTTSVVKNVTFTIKSWSYFSISNQFFAVCGSSLVVNVVPQSIVPTVALGLCLQSVGAQNTLIVNFSVENVLVADLIGLASFSGKLINNTGSLPITFNTVSSQYESLITSTLITLPTSISLTLTLTNPTYIPSQQPSIIISLYRKLTSNTSLSNTYAQTSVPVDLCPVTLPMTSSSSLLSLSSSTTYQSSVMYYIELASGSLQLKDYALNDYFIINFKANISNAITAYANTDSPFQLFSFAPPNSPIVSLNSQYNLPSQIFNASALKITLNSTTVVSLVNNQGVSSLYLTLKSLSNPYFQNSALCVINFYMLGGFLKETLTTSQVPIAVSPNTELSLFTSSQITLLQVNNTIIMTIASLSNKTLLAVSYSFISQLYLYIKTPFSCSNTNSTNETMTVLPAINTSSINITLTQCELGYFQDNTESVVVKQFARFTHSNLTVNYLPTTSSTYALKSTCGDQCHLCDLATTNCLQCFNSTYNLLNYLYPSTGKCYESCPSGTFGNGFTCQICHEICQQCTDSFYTSCTTCAANFVKNLKGVCQSTCGSGMYLTKSDSSCKSCNPNCQRCLNDTYCYSCRSGAIMIDNMCVFSQCQSPCATCQISMDHCLTCVTSTNSSQYYFYQNKCVTQCPSGTFKWDFGSGSTPKICLTIQSANVYFVGLILSVIVFGIGMSIRCFAPKKTKLYKTLKFNGNDDKNSLIKSTNLQRKLSETFNNAKVNTLQLTQQPKSSLPSSSYKLYKLNLFRFMTVLMGYIEIVCVIVILAQGGMYNPRGVNEMIAVGFVGLVATNAVFGVKYFRTVYRKLKSRRQKFIEINLVVGNKKLMNSNQHQQGQQQQPPQAIKQQQIVIDNHNLSDEIQAYKEPIPSQTLQYNNNFLNQNTSDKNKKLHSQHSYSDWDHDQEMTKQQKERVKQCKNWLKQFDDQMAKELLIGVLGCIFTLRTYNILRSNLFVLFEHADPVKSSQQLLSSTQVMNRKVSNSFQMQSEELIGSHSALKLPHQQKEISKVNNPVELKKTEPMIPSKTSNKVSIVNKKNTVKQKQPNLVKIQPFKDMKLPLTNSNKNITQRSNISNTNNSKQSQPQPQQNQSIPSPIEPLSLGLLSTFSKPNLLLSFKHEITSHFYHPFYTYLMFASLVFVTLMFGISSAILIFKGRYQNMMIWGIDGLLVMGISFLLNIFDLWKVVNLSKHDQESQVSTERQKIPQINETIENMRDQFEQGKDFDDLKFVSLQEVGNEVNLQISNDLSATKKLQSSSLNIGEKKTGFSQLKINASKSKSGINEKDMEVKQKKSISPKSPSIKSDKTKVFKSNKKRIVDKGSDGQQEYIDEQPPELKIFDDLGLEEEENVSVHRQVNKGLKLQRQNQEKQLSRTTLTGNKLSKARSQNRTLNSRKAEMSSNMMSQTSRNSKGANSNNTKNYKLDDIYLGFLQPQNNANSSSFPPRNINPRLSTQPLSQEQQNDDDQIETVKLSTKQMPLMNNTKQQSIINIVSNSDQQSEMGNHQQNVNKQNNGNKLKIIQRGQNNNSAKEDQFVTD